VCLLWALSPVRFALAGDSVVVVVSEAWPERRSISLRDLRRLYLGTLTRTDSIRVVCFDQPSGSPEREVFSRAVLGRSELQMHDYWIEQALTGGALPPRELGSALEVLQLVGRNVGMIGYVRWSEFLGDPSSGVRVLTLSDGGRDWHPGDTGYPIQIAGPPIPNLDVFERGEVGE